jgi:5-methylcytosine-specific restriction endonuclease McrA
VPKRVPTFRPSGQTSDRRARDRLYDRTKRDQKSKRIYHHKNWPKVRALQLSRHPECQDCYEQRNELVSARFVHHVLSVRDRPDLVFDPDNLRSLCPACHNRVEKAT